MFAIHLLEKEENQICAACLEQKEVVELSMGRESPRGGFAGGYTAIKLCTDCANKIKNVLAVMARDKN